MLNSARPPDAAEESGGESGKRQVDELTEDIGGMGLDDA